MTRNKIQETRNKTILHFDGDSFFASVSQVLDYRLKGKPLVTGSERGVITSASLEAKKLGINRGVSMKDAKEMCPGLIIVSGNYLMYSIFASRMYSIVSEFTDKVEEYSIDECFADITGLEKDVGKKIKRKLESSLGITFGVGVAPTKVLAKVASKYRKPAGYTDLTEENVDEILRTLPCGKIWGIGPSASFALSKLGVKTALEFKEKSENWIEANEIAKPLREIWLELNGVNVNEINTESKPPHSIIKSRTFRPSSADRKVVLSELSRNIEAACAKARGCRLRAKDFRFYLKTQEFRYQGFEVSLPQATASPTEFMRYVRENFDKVYKPRTLYRATGITLGNLTKNLPTPDLFGQSEVTEKQAAVFKAVDKISRRFGDGVVMLGLSLNASKIRQDHHEKTLDLPFLGTAR